MQRLLLYKSWQIAGGSQTLRGEWVDAGPLCCAIHLAMGILSPPQLVASHFHPFLARHCTLTRDAAASIHATLEGATEDHPEKASAIRGSRPSPLHLAREVGIVDAEEHLDDCPEEQNGVQDMRSPPLRKGEQRQGGEGEASVREERQADVQP